ncbi:MAG: translational GTPase TypA, partial [Chlamydiia bacterium]|nr:translational GTPase TypA [Chlamydiia bacterium]
RDDAMRVSGRGELHISVLIETMRREWFEMAISKPKVITQVVDGVIEEPMERVHIEVPEEFSGTIIEDLSRRKGEMQALSTSEHGLTTMQFLVPTRGLMGYRSDFLTRTSGLGILTSIFEKFVPWKGDLPGRTRGVLISNSPGKANAYALFNLQERGFLFVKPGDDVYEGMVVGEHSRENDLVVNATKAKQLTNVRAAGSDENLLLTPPHKFTLEQAIDYIADDELVEVTPNSIRLRKRFLTENERKRQPKGNFS